MRLIDADALKKAIIKHLCVKSENNLLPAEKSIYNLIDEQPTIDQPKWIPSSERLPEMFEDVLVYGSFGYEIMHIEDANFNGGVEWCNDHDYFVPVCDTIWIALSKLFEYANADGKDGEYK